MATRHPLAWTDPQSPSAPVARGLKLLIPVKSFDGGGTEKVAMAIGAAFAGEGAEVRVTMPGRDGGLAALPLFAATGQRSEALTAWQLLRRLPALVRDTAPDVMLLPGNAYSLMGAVVKLRLGRRAPRLLLKISNDLVRPDLPLLLRGLYRLWLRLQPRFFDALVAIAPPAEAEARRLMRPAPGQLVTINDPALAAAARARLAALRDAGRPPRTGRHFVSVGRLAPQKHQTLLIDCFADIAGPDDRLTILGEGPERRRLEQRAKARGVAAQVQLPGHCRDIGPALADADVFVLASRYEGLPAVLVEALAAGVPVVTTACSVNMPWLTRDLARCVPPGDRAALAQAMAAAAGGTAPVAAMRARAAAFDTGTNARLWLELALRLAGRRPATL